jgi:hypothetical protein
MTDLTKREQGTLASIALEGLTRKYHKANPGLTKAQAYTAVYEAPENINLRAAERNSFYEGAGINKEYIEPIAKSSPAEEGYAFAYAMKLAKAAHDRDPSKSVAKHFTKLWEDPRIGEILRRHDRSERRLPE